MYFIGWNQEENKLVASIGGHVTASEAKVFVDEAVRELNEVQVSGFSFELDYSCASRLDDGVIDTLNILQTYSKLRGAGRYVCVARDEREVEFLITNRLQQVLEGAEEYRLSVA